MAASFNVLFKKTVEVNNTIWIWGSNVHGLHGHYITMKFKNSTNIYHHRLMHRLEHEIHKFTNPRIYNLNRGDRMGRFD
jgi:alpha-tubulin suppressor-like RCC1 family protein